MYINCWIISRRDSGINGLFSSYEHAIFIEWLRQLHLVGPEWSESQQPPLLPEWRDPISELGGGDLGHSIDGVPRCLTFFPILLTFSRSHWDSSFIVLRWAHAHEGDTQFYISTENKMG